MKKICLLLLVTLLSTVAASAQTIVTTVEKEFKVNGATKDVYKFLQGDTVTIYGFKKKSDRLYFAAETKDYANLFNMAFNPFAADEKQLKKLPNALGSDMTDLIRQKKQEKETAKLQQRKKDALDGKIRAIASNDYSFKAEENTIGKISKGDTVVILGYGNGGSRYSSYHHFALYTKSAAGVFRTIGNSNLFKYTIDLEHLPTVTDPDVLAIIDQKKEEIRQNQKKQLEQFRADALNGKLHVTLYLGDLRTKEGNKSPFSYGDTLSIIGYSKKDSKEQYALFSPKGAGVFQTTYSSGSAFKNIDKITFADLPSTDSPEVLAVIDRQQHIADSLQAAKDAADYAKYQENATKIIQIYKEADPVIVTVDSWTSNSVGGIEVNLSVTNCSMQTIKYISFQGYFNNAVGDRCRNEIGGGTVWKARGIGPIGPRPTTFDNFTERFSGCRASYDFDNLTFYSRVADTFHLSAVTIQYTNGKTVTLSGNSLRGHVIYE